MGVCESCQACQRPRIFKSPIESTPVPPIFIWTLDWWPEYINCSEWGDIFLLVQGVVSDWPEGYQFRGGRLVYGGKVCVPTPLQERVIYDHHHFFWDMLDFREFGHTWKLGIIGGTTWAQKIC